MDGQEMYAWWCSEYNEFSLREGPHFHRRWERLTEAERKAWDSLAVIFGVAANAPDRRDAIEASVKGRSTPRKETAA